MSIPKPIQGILDIAPYVGGDASDDQDAVKLSSNESALGPSKAAIAAFKSVAQELHRYPDGGSEALRATLAHCHGLGEERIVCGNGSDEIISTLVNAYCGPGDEVVYSAHGFLMYRISALAAGATPVAAPEQDFTSDVDALLAAVTPRTRMVFIANPNNPTGTFLPLSEIKRLHAGLRDDILLVIDAAYAEFVTRNDYGAGIDLVDGAENVVVTRTFSKIHGLAALRLGWAYCPEQVLAVYQRVRGPFNVNMAAQAAGIAALQDTAHRDASRSHNDIWMPWLSAELGQLGLRILPSVANFISVEFPPAGQSATDHSAQAAHAYLKQHNILPRAIAAYGMPNWLRFTVGLESENRIVVDTLKEFLAA